MVFQKIRGFLIEEILKNINDSITIKEYSLRTDDFKKNLDRFIELLTSYNINPGFIEYEVKRCIGISGFPGQIRLSLDLKNPNLDSGIPLESQQQIFKDYHNFFGETVYAEDIQLSLGQEKPRDAPVDHKIKKIPDSLGISSTASTTVTYEDPLKDTKEKTEENIWSLNDAHPITIVLPLSRYQAEEREIQYFSEDDIDRLRKHLIEDIEKGYFSDTLYEFEDIIKRLSKRFGLSFPLYK